MTYFTAMQKVLKINEQLVSALENCLEDMEQSGLGYTSMDVAEELISKLEASPDVPKQKGGSS